LDASVRIAVGDLESGLAALEAAADRVTDRVTCLKEVFDAASSVNDTVRARRALELIATAGCSSANECVDNLLYAASREERGSALARIRRACDLAPEDNVLLGRAATLASSVGMYGEALRDYEELARREPHEQKWHQAAAEQRRALLHLTLPGAAR
jgi:tetratricopeptide (TPR) repeat protein